MAKSIKNSASVQQSDAFMFKAPFPGIPEPIWGLPDTPDFPDIIPTFPGIPRPEFEKLNLTVVEAAPEPELNDIGQMMGDGLFGF